MIKNYETDKRIKVVLCLSLLFIVFAGCSQNLPTRPQDLDLARVALRVSVEQSSKLDPIAFILLTVTAPDMDTIQDTILVYNSSFEKSLTVPAGTDERLFTLEAKNANDKILYAGSTFVKVVGGGTNTVEINLMPAVLMIKLTPRYNSVNENEEFDLNVEVYNVDSLFGASFRILFDNSLLQYRSVDPPTTNGILGPRDSFIFFDTTETGYVAISITRKFPADPVEGSGALAQLTFRSISTGTTSLTFEPSNLRLIQGNGSYIPDFDSLVVDEAIVDIIK
jgi:hypothetical protein